jgi:putative transposase
MMCRLMRVSRSAYYAWLQHVPTTAEKADAELTLIIKNVFQKSRSTYGSRRIQQALLQRDCKVSRRRISRLMRAEDLICKTRRQFRATTNSRHDQPVAPNHLDRQFTVSQSNQVYVGDITYRAPSPWRCYG